MKLPAVVQKGIRAIIYRDSNQLDEAILDLGRFPDHQLCLAGLLRESVYAEFAAGVTLLLNVGAQATIADLSLAIRKRRSDIVQSLRSPTLMEILAPSLSDESFIFAIQTVEPSSWRQYSKLTDNRMRNTDPELKAKVAKWLADYIYDEADSSA